MPTRQYQSLPYDVHTFYVALCMVYLKQGLNYTLIPITYSKYKGGICIPNSTTEVWTVDDVDLLKYSVINMSRLVTLFIRI